MEELTLLNQLSFWLFSALIIGGAFGVVFHRSIVYSALLLLITFLSIAAVFILLNAPFIAAAQVLIYGVGLTIVLIFGIMLTGDKPFKDPVGQERPKRYWILPGIVASAFLGLLLWALLYPNFQLTAINGLFSPRSPQEEAAGAMLQGLQAILSDGGAQHIGQLLFSKYLVPFELASILLLLAMMGAILLSKREFPEEEGEPALEADSIIEDTAVKSCCCFGQSGTCSGGRGNGTIETSGTSEDQSEKEALGVH